MQTSAPLTNWTCVASSADGSKVAAVAPGSGVYFSTNFGATWDLSSAPIDSDSVGCSGDGTRWVAGPALYISTDTGTTWTPSDALASAWSPVASSADGRTLVGLHFYGEVILSTNAGATWNLTNMGSAYLSSVASSADGSKMVACAYTTYYNLLPGAVFASTNSGFAWTPTGAPRQRWSAVASSADGTKLAAAGGTIYTSTDSGGTWTSNSAPVANWRSITCSADGGKLVAVVKGGGIWTTQTSTAPSLNIIRSGDQFVLSWTVPSTSFALQQNPDLNTTDWTDLTDPPTLDSTNLQYQVTVPMPAGNRFYRLKH
jgi:hypothetical protein